MKRCICKRLTEGLLSEIFDFGVQSPFLCSRTRTANVSDGTLRPRVKREKLKEKSVKKLATSLLLMQTVGIRSICIYVHFSNQIKQTWDRIQTSRDPTDSSTSEDYRH